MLQGKVAVITGAGRGIGAAIAQGYAANGAAVVCAARTTGEIEATAGKINAAGGQALAVQTDVTDWESVQALYAATLEAFGKVNIVVINAGGNLDRQRIEDSDPKNWRATIDLNLTSAYYCAKAAIPHMKVTGGQMIIIGSGMGHRAAAGGSAYAASKAGAWMLTRVLADELRDYQICVNELIPGPVRTQLLPKAPDDPNHPVHQDWHKEPEDVVPLALYLATQPLTGASGQSFSLMRRDSQ